jgi:hypothetical protein
VWTVDGVTIESSDPLIRLARYLSLQSKALADDDNPDDLSPEEKSHRGLCSSFFCIDLELVSFDVSSPLLTNLTSIAPLSAYKCPSRR